MQKNLYCLFLVFMCMAQATFASDVGVAGNLKSSVKEIPSQATLQKVGSWSRGPIALASFLVMSDLLDFNKDNPQEFENFLEYCPRSVGKPTTQMGNGLCIGVAGFALGACYTGGNLLTTLVSGAMAAGPYAAEYFNHYYGWGKIGPAPRWLADYGNQILQEKEDPGQGTRIVVKKFEKENEVITCIRGNLDKGKPVIVLTNDGPFSWQYLNIVSYKSNGPETFEYLDTNNGIGTIASKDLIKGMDFNKESTTKNIKSVLEYGGYYLKVDIGRFNVIYAESMGQ